MKIFALGILADRVFCSPQADKLQTLLTAAKVQEVEPIWTSIFAKALEGKDIKDLLTNVGSGGAAPAGAAAAAGGAAAPAEAAAEEKKEEGNDSIHEESAKVCGVLTFAHREGGVRRGHGLRSFRLSVFTRSAFLISFFTSFLPYLLFALAFLVPHTTRPHDDQKGKFKRDQRTKTSGGTGRFACMMGSMTGTGTDDAMIPAIRLQSWHTYGSGARSCWPSSFLCYMFPV
ncbi:unnamed protein product [Aspergillus oryzae]|uniref:Large ribosomal subunit protein P1 n=2 Tax=Aspergillus oryzae TaxID=5062 RepID=A0AAN5BUH3_ASPOZ|nr:unnamed protein product [Aspergillus oryzae]GMF89165.1 unnamed protein product [Aspergillus oryzae]GMG02927.1 unnamed protein product [Aspergillus oryzae]GMG25774.1 unnamed protein product [Aspergillus oryzae]GMG48877.1 unnamed protein product [Aspergillus oryzae var. brunneus]